MRSDLYTSLILSLLVLSPAMAQWDPLNVGQGTILSSTTDAAAIYVVSQTNGVFKSVNDGATWTAANNGLPVAGGNNEVRSVSATGGAVFAGTTTGVFRSTDGGTNWSNINGPLSFSDNVYANKWYTFGNTTLAVFTGTIANGGGIARTTNNGTTWLMGHSGMSSNLTVNNITSNGTTLFAATTVGLFRSDDMAASWTAVPATNFSIHAVEWINGRLVCIVAGSNYRYSTNEGQSWTVSEGSPANAPKGELKAFEGRLYAISGTPSGCLWSTDNGTSFEPNNVGLMGFDMYGQYQFHHAGDRLYMGTTGDLYRIQGLSTSVEASPARSMPTPYPTMFQDRFHVDLTGLPAGGTIVLMDMMGRTVAHHRDLSAGPVTVQRQGLAAGRYECIWTNTGNGTRHRLGPVIAE